MKVKRWLGFVFFGLFVDFVAVLDFVNLLSLFRIIVLIAILVQAEITSFDYNLSFKVNTFNSFKNH